ncbi:hypothetical protein EIP91_007652 [Steccherinum ochraceum]|uniref:DUF2470 domain-containing protein n=1 Tax=Steccherinum ochraceum TaxID=92696 RepID=A0A4R0REA5_9APHY|nr:hypothetical protein EIP91_007652 [Steccherinum ochraceum]
MADPVAAQSKFLCMYMSQHPDTLVSYVKYWGKVTEHVVSAQLTSIDTNGMNLTYKTKAGGEAKKEVRVVFDPPLAGYEEVKPRLMNMKADADEALGVTRSPQIDTFHLPTTALYVGIAIGALVYTTYAPAPSSPSYSPIYAGANLLRYYVPGWFIKFSWALVYGLHSLESLYTFSLCRKHRTPFVVGAQYVIATLLFGGPIWIDMRRRERTKPVRAAFDVATYVVADDRFGHAAERASRLRRAEDALEKPRTDDHMSHTIPINGWTGQAAFSVHILKADYSGVTAGTRTQ